MTNEPTARRLRVATYNVHGCIGTDGQRSEGRIAEVIASLSAEIVGLQELDLGRARSSHADQAALIAEELGWKYHFHPAMRSGDEQYGNAIVSRFPITLKRAAKMPGAAPWYCREQRGAIWMQAETDLGPVHIINSHFGLGRSERRSQAVANWTGLARLRATGRIGDSTRRFQQCADLARLPAHTGALARRANAR